MNTNKKTTTRTENTIRNISFGMINKLLALLIPFLVRTVLILVLGAEYVGINSLFTSILQVLNVTELGFSSAILFSMYAPVAENDVDKIISKLSVYRTVYIVIGGVIFILGCCLIPMLPKLIKGTYPDTVSLYIVFLIYLANSSISYLVYGFKSSVLIVYQRIDLISKVQSLIEIMRGGIQILILLVFHSFYAYLIVLPVTTIISNLMISFLADRFYPQFNLKYKITFRGLREIGKQIGGIAIGRISLVCRNSFDNIIISALFGLTLTAIYSNYYYIFFSVSGFLYILLTSMSAGVGNSLVTESKSKNEKDHLRFDFYYELIVGICTICLFCLYQPFMKLWAGEELMLADDSMTLFCVYFYTNHLAQVRSVYSEAAGLWWFFKYLSIGEMVANLLLNIVLGIWFGVNGILIATIITSFLCSFIGCTIVTYKRLFNISPVPYFLYNLVYGLVILVGCIGIGFVARLISVDGWIELLFKAVLVFILSVGYLIAISLINPKTRMYLCSAKGYIRRKNIE